MTGRQFVSVLCLLFGCFYGDDSEIYVFKLTMSNVLHTICSCPGLLNMDLTITLRLTKDELSSSYVAVKVL